jgi:hypothetical protein
MRTSRRTRFLLAATCAAAMAASVATVQAQIAVPRNGGWQATQIRDAYDRGYREGIQRGERDGRDGRNFDYTRDGTYRSADSGYNQRYGTRDAYRGEFRRGYQAGYRVGYDRYRVVQNRRNDRWDRRVPRGYQEPAAARGYGDGFEQGFDDGRDRDRYDPVRHGDYRDGDEGYYREYGSRDAYKNNYRAGFRQGYEDGYRDGARR